MDQFDFYGIVTEFATYLEREKGRAAATRHAYRQSVERFLAAARGQPGALFLPPEWTLPDLDKRAVEAYLTQRRQAHGWKPRTAAHHLTALHGFFAFLHLKGHIPRNPVKGMRIPVPTTGSALPEGGEAAVRTLFARRAGNLVESRLLLLLELIYGGGLRPSEVYGARGLAVRSGGEPIRLELERGDLELTLSPAGIARAGDYLARREAALRTTHREERKPAATTGAHPGGPPAPIPGEEPFWIDRRLRPVSPAALARQVRRAMEGAGLTGGGSELRRLAARHFRARGADVRSLRNFLGAKRLGSLDRYGQVGYREVAEAFRRAHPRESED